jgi:VIT1/CCC1 family predicted Fe2+/Mn2+ transporter
MENPSLHREKHRAERIGWLRAAVLGANDGIVSTASLLVGVAAAEPTRSAVILAGVAGLAAGAMSMAAGEYVSVSSQADTELADRSRERRELAEQPELELAELERIYVERGLTESVAKQVARQLTEHGALEAHLRDELGLSKTLAARPVQAALASAGTFALGAALPLLVASIAPPTTLVAAVSIASLLSLALLGAISAAAGGSPLVRPTLRVCLWGALAMALTAIVGRLAGAIL